MRLVPMAPAKPFGQIEKSRDLKKKTSETRCSKHMVVPSRIFRNERKYWKLSYVRRVVSDVTV